MTSDDADHEADQAKSGITRRTVVGLGWTVPIIALAAPVPAFAASVPLPQNSGLNANTGVFPDNVQGNPRAYAYPESFDAASGFFIVVTIAASGAAGISLTSIPGASQTQLNGWEVVTESPTQVVLRWPTPVSGTEFNTANYRWYWTGLAAPESISVTGAITGTPIVSFDEGTIVGPPA